MDTRAKRPRAEDIEIVDDVMAEIYARKSGAERLAIAAGLFRSAQSMLLCHLRQEHPEWSEERLGQDVARRLSHGTR
jgi:hypothetical protein